MRGLPACILLMAFWGLVGCGDNSKQCGEGTNDLDGDNICQPDETEPVLCGDGTSLDMLTGECVPDPSLCGGGTVLINGMCQDPTEGLVIDLEEGPEPNGFDPGSTPAGTITLKPPGGAGFVIHGCVQPVDNNSPDLDVYLLTVSQPTLLEITADGVGGLAGGFIALGDDPVLSSWFRLGINLTSDTSKRQLLLPTAGSYELVMTDSRTLLPITQNGEGFPVAGNPDGSSCYYATVKQLAFPSSESLDLVNGAAGTIGSELRFFNASFPTGLTSLIGVIDPEDLDDDGIPDIDSRAASSLVLINNGQLRQINDSGDGFPANTPVSTMLFGGIEQGDVPIVVLDYVWNMTPFPADFRIDVEAAIGSQALATDGSTVNATSNGQSFTHLGVRDFEKLNLFHFDVTTADEIDGIDIAFSIPIQGSVIDQDGRFVSPFTGVVSEDDTGNPTINTFTSYKGLLRNRLPGRYYFFVFAPRDPAGTAFTVASTIDPQTPDLVTLDTPTADTPVNAFNSSALTYDAGAEPWQLLNATGTTTGDLDVALFDPANTTPSTPGFAFGRLDTLVTTFNSDAPVTQTGDGTPLVGVTFAADGSTPVGRIFKNPDALQPPAVTSFLVKVNPVTPTASPSFVLDFATRVYEDFGGPAIADGQTKNASGTIAIGSVERYYFETAPGNIVTITVTPTGGTPTLDAVVDLLDIDESARTTIDDQLGTTAETITFTQNPSGFTAFDVRGALGVSVGDFDVSVQVAGP